MQFSGREFRAGCLSLAVSLLFAASSPAQLSTTPKQGIRENDPRLHALTNARIVAAPGKTIEKGTVLIRDGLIVEVGADVKVPAEARVWDLAGKTIYPGFIDAYSRLDCRRHSSRSRSARSGSGRSKGEAKGNSAAKAPRERARGIRASLRNARRPII